MNEPREIEFCESDLIDVEPIPVLNIPELNVTACKRPKNPLYNYLVFFCEPAERYEKGCAECGSIDYVKHGNVTRTIHDINIGLQRVDIFLTLPRYYCKDCGLSFRYLFEEIPENAHYTKRLYEQIRREALLRPFTDVASEFGYKETTIRKIFDEYIAELEAERGQLIAPRVLGIDEKHIVHKMSGVYVDVENGVLLEMSEKNDHDTVIGVIESMKGYENIEIVTMDMSNGYRSYIQECLPNAKIIVDKFHVYQNLYNKVSEMKKRITAHIKDKIDKMPESKEKARLNEVYGHIVKKPYLFKYSEKKLADSQELTSLMAEACECFPELNHLQTIKEGFTRIYEHASTLQEAEKLFEEWQELIPPKAAAKRKVWEKKYHVPAILYAEANVFLNSVNNWHKEIFAYFEPGCQFTNATTEGMNRLIQTIEEEGSGYGFKRLRGKCIYGSQMNKRITYKFKTKRKEVYGMSFSVFGGGLRVVGYEDIQVIEREDVAVDFLENS